MRTTARRRWPGKAAFLLVLSTPTFLLAGEAHYLLMFGSQRVPNSPDYAHSFATFVRASWPGDGPCPPSPCLEAHTISWLPCTLIVRTLATRPEPGRNLGLEETLEAVRSTGQRVSLWGPYEIEAELYERALRRASQLESGEVLYKANDAFRRDDRVTNCIHAVSNIAEGSRLVIPTPRWGESASYAILRKMQPWVIEPDQPRYWVSSALGLDAVPLIYRDRASPRSGASCGLWRRLFGKERGREETFGPPR